MKFYLSSYKVGNHGDKLQTMFSPHNKKVGYIPNALDFSKRDPERRIKHVEADIDDLKKLGLEAELLDLKQYFGQAEKLRKKLDKLGGIFISGGNTFVLRQAMRISGFDKIIKDLMAKDDFVYAGYSAGICILAPDLKSLQIVDDPTDTPYEIKNIVWEGLNILDYMILPHYKSEHYESAKIDEEVAYCEKNNIPFKTLRDGEVIILEQNP